MLAAGKTIEKDIDPKSLSVACCWVRGPRPQVRTGCIPKVSRYSGEPVLPVVPLVWNRALTIAVFAST